MASISYSSHFLKTSGKPFPPFQEYPTFNNFQFSTLLGSQSRRNSNKRDYNCHIVASPNCVEESGSQSPLSPFGIASYNENAYNRNGLPPEAMLSFLIYYCQSSDAVEGVC